MSNIPRVPQNKRVFWTGFATSRFKMLLCPEQKNTVFGRHRIQACSVGPDVNCCAGTLTVVKACMLFPEQRRIFECDQDLDRVASSLSHLALIFARQKLNEEWYISGDDEAQRAASTFVNAMKELDFKRRVDVCDTLAGVCIMQMFPRHILFHQSTNYMEYALYDQAKYIPEKIWTHICRSLLDMFAIRHLIAVKGCVCGVKMNASNFRHDSGKWGVF